MEFIAQINLSPLPIVSKPKSQSVQEHSSPFLGLCPSLWVGKASAPCSCWPRLRVQESWGPGWARASLVGSHPLPGVGRRRRGAGPPHGARGGKGTHRQLGTLPGQVLFPRGLLPGCEDTDPEHEGKQQTPSETASQRDAGDPPGCLTLLSAG